MISESKISKTRTYAHSSSPFSHTNCISTEITADLLPKNADSKKNWTLHIHSYHIDLPTPPHGVHRVITYWDLAFIFLHTHPKLILSLPGQPPGGSSSRRRIVNHSDCPSRRSIPYLGRSNGGALIAVPRGSARGAADSFAR